MGEEMRRRIGLERVGFLNFPAAARDMHFGLADLDRGELRRRLFQNGIVLFAGLAGGESIGHDGARALREFFIVGVADVENGAHRAC